MRSLESSDWIVYEQIDDKIIEYKNIVPLGKMPKITDKKVLDIYCKLNRFWLSNEIEFGNIYLTVEGPFKY